MAASTTSGCSDLSTRSSRLCSLFLSILSMRQPSALVRGFVSILSSASSPVCGLCSLQNDFLCACVHQPSRRISWDLTLRFSAKSLWCIYKTDKQHRCQYCRVHCPRTLVLSRVTISATGTGTVVCLSSPSRGAIP
jgi:hypothetical protein